jgi:hypothetical protein
MKQPSKLDVPLNNSIRSLQVVCHRCPFKVSHDKQVRKGLLEGSIPTPNIIPKTDPRTFARIKSEMAPKNLPTLSNVFPETHPMRARDDP